MTTPAHGLGSGRYPFRFTSAYRLPALLFGVTPRTAWAAVHRNELEVHFGLWRLRTPLTNIKHAQRTGGFGFIKTAGPAHLSLADHGITFATNGDDAVCLEFHAPVPAMEPTGRLLHPGATLTVADPEALLHILDTHGVSVS
ncbi:MAG: hypothetical protein L0H74_14985 [Brachybacterium sp.]|nr:hypothetical protein [Brachybacterium sp.]